MGPETLQEWFLFLGNNTDKVKSYETTIDKFYDKLFQGNPNKDNAKSHIYLKPISKGFQNKELKKFNKYINGTIKNGCVFGALFFVLTTLLYIILHGMDCIKHYNNDTKIKLFLASCKESWILAIILGIVSFITILSLCVLLRYISLKHIGNNLTKMETAVEPILTIIPPKYRNSDYMELLYRIYYERSNITLTQALDVVENIARENKISDMPAVMFDIPYINPINDLQSNNLDNKQQYNNQDNINEEDDKPKNPNLPEDIASHTYSGSDNAEKDLNSMIGLDSVKQQIEKLKNRISFYGTADVGSGGSHMVFLGNAGTGKTTVARIITKILYDFGYIKQNKCVEISGDYLKSPYNGQTGDRTAAIVEYSFGGVLFIDEAYLLYESGNSASQEATGVLLKAMEDHRKDFVVILAGYEEQMTKLLVSNEGFASRIKYKIYFPNYTTEEMYQIFTSFINRYNNKIYVVEDSAKELLLQTFELEKQSRFFGNARTVRNAVDTIMDYYADRCVQENTKEALIKYEDVAAYAKDREKELQSELRNASATNQLDESIIRLAELKQKMKQGSNNPEEDIQKLIGLDGIKNEIAMLKNQIEFYGDNYQQTQQNILLIGPDGCGKSSVVNILTGFLYKYGYINENRYLDISAEYLKGSYVGHTSRRAESIISYAKGGVLYIRNVNMLTSATSSDSYGQEAMSAIITALSNNPDLVIIIADTSIGYLQNVRNMFNFVYEFPNYTASELIQIFNIQAVNDGFQVEQNVFNILMQYLQNNPINASGILHLYDMAKRIHINNFNGGNNKFIIDSQDIRSIINRQNMTNNPTSIEGNIKHTTKVKLNINKK